MKKGLFYVLTACLMACPVFTSCSDDDDEVENPDIGTELVIDEVEYLQNSLVKVDENGKFLYRICGKPLDDADTTKLYLGVKDVAEAKARFRGFFPETTQFEESGQQVVARLKDNAGTVTFIETANEEEIARVEFSVSPSLHLVSSFHFLNENAWPDNDESEFVEGDAFSFDGMRYVCIRSDANGNPALFFHISPEKFMVKEMRSNVSFAEAAVIRDILLADDGRRFAGFQKLFERAGLTLTKNEDYSICETKAPGFWDTSCTYYTINLETGKTEDHWGKYEFRFWHIFTIG